MLAKIWKKVLLIILIIFCLWNIINKLSKIISFDATISKAQNAIQNIGNKKDKTNDITQKDMKNNLIENNNILL